MDLFNRNWEFIQEYFVFSERTFNVYGKQNDFYDKILSEREHSSVVNYASSKAKMRTVLPIF